MRAKDFLGENYPPTPVSKKDAALSKQAKHLKMKSMLAPRPVATMVGANKGFMDTMSQTKQDADTLSKAAGIDPNLTRNAVAKTMQNAQPSARLKAKFGKPTNEHLSNDSAVKPNAKFGPNSQKVVGEKKRKRQTGKKTHLDMSKK